MIHDFDLNTLNEARGLLYHCYIERMQWNIEQNNYSGIYIEKINQQFCLCDDYDQIAIWFLVKRNNRVVACARLCTEDFNEKLELERYSEAQRILGSILRELKRNFRIFELNREALLPDDSDGNFAGIFLLKKILEYCILNRYAIITATHLNFWVNTYNRILFPQLEECQFKYSITDSEKVTVYFASEENIKSMYKRLILILSEREMEKC